MLNRGVRCSQNRGLTLLGYSPGYAYGHCFVVVGELHSALGRAVEPTICASVRAA